MSQEQAKGGLYIAFGVFALTALVVFFLFIKSVIIPDTETNKTNTKKTSPGSDPLVTVVPDEFQNTENAKLSISSNDPSRGADNAPVTIVIFSDFQCEFCVDAKNILSQLEFNFPGDVRVVWKDFPNDRVHPDAIKAAEAARCAQIQGKFWEYHDELFANQTLLGVDFYKSTAQKLGLDTQKFNSCLTNEDTQGMVQKGQLEGVALGITGTPYFFVNETRVSGAKSYSFFANLVQSELNKQKTESL